MRLQILQAGGGGGGSEEQRRRERDLEAATPGPSASDPEERRRETYLEDATPGPTAADPPEDVPDVVAPSGRTLANVAGGYGEDGAPPDPESNAAEFGRDLADDGATDATTEAATSFIEDGADAARDAVDQARNIGPNWLDEAAVAGVALLVIALVAWLVRPFVELLTAGVEE